MDETGADETQLPEHIARNRAAWDMARRAPGTRGCLDELRVRQRGLGPPLAQRRGLGRSQGRL